MTQTPPRTLPPPSVPREVTARARVRALQEELGSATDPRVWALLHFELGALHEHALDDAASAKAQYRLALERAPSFVPALLALLRLHDERDHPGDTVELWSQLAAILGQGPDRASALCEAGILLYDRLGRAERAVGLFQQALAESPRCATAALLLEQHGRLTRNVEAAVAALTAHAEACEDRELAACLMCELALLTELAGEPTQALQLLLKATELGTSALNVWSLVEALARDHDQTHVLRSSVTALASIWTERGRHAVEPEERARAMRLAVAFEREAARRALDAAESGAARECSARAVALWPEDWLARYEHVLMLNEQGDHAAAASAAAELASAVDDAPLAAVLRVRAARSRRAVADAPAELTLLEAAVRAAPESAAATGAYENALLRSRSFAKLCEQLRARAERCSGDARSEHLLHAARLTLLELEDGAAASDLLREGSASTERPESMLAWSWAAAVYAGAHAAAIDAAARLAGTGASATTRQLARLDQYLRTSRALGDEHGALAVLVRALEEPDNAGWAAQLLRAHAAARGDARLLARAHRALAASAQGLVRAAHLGAAARAHRRAGDFDAATAAVHELLELAPDDAYALALLEESLLDAGAEREAAEVLRKAARAHADGQRRELDFLHAGAASEGAGDVDSAARSYDEAVGFDPLALSPRWALRRLGERSGDPALLQRALRGLAERESRVNGSAIARLEWAELCAAHGNHAEARESFAAALSDPAVARSAALGLCLLPPATGSAALEGLALERLSSGAESEAKEALTRARIACLFEANPEEGRAALEDALAQDPTDPWLALRALGQSRDAEERSAAALRLAKAATDGSTSAELTLHAVRAAVIAHGQDANEDALLRALHATERAPGSLAAAIALEEALSAIDDAESRSLALGGRLAHASAEGSAPLLAAWARAQIDAGRPADAAEIARRAVEGDPQDLSMLELLREASRALGDSDTAAEAALQLAEHADGTFRAQLLEHAASMLDEDLAGSEEVERCLQGALESDPQSEVAFAELHDRLLDRGELDALLALIDRRLESEPQGAEREELRYERALVLRAGGRLDETVTALEQVLAQDPGHAGAIGLLVETSTALGRFDQAVGALRKLAAASVSEGERRLARLGAAEFLERKLGDLDGAATELEALLQSEPGDRNVALRIADLHERSGRYRQTVEAYRKLATGRPRLEAAELERRAARILHRHLGAVSEAVEAYERALDQNPVDAEATFELLALLEPGQARTTRLQRFEASLRDSLQREPAQPELLRALSRLGTEAARPELTLVAEAALAALEPGRAGTRRQAEPAAAPGLDRLSATSLASLTAELARSPLHAVAQLICRGLAGPEAGATDTVARGADPSARFLAGRRALAERLGVSPLIARPRAAQRRMLRAGLRAGGLTDAVTDPEVDALTKAITKRLPRAERKQLAREVGVLSKPEFALDDYLEALELACDRAGLLLSDDIGAALAHVLGGQRVELELLAMQPRAIELLRLWLGRELPGLRREIGWGEP